MVIIPALGNVINVTTSIRNISLLPADLVHSHVAEKPLFVFPRLERSSKARLYAHSIHPVENLLDSFIIAGLKGNNLVYCEDELTNRAPAASGCHMSKTSIAGRASHYWGHQTWTDLDTDLVWLQRRSNIKIDGGSLFLRLAATSGLLLDERNFLFSLLLIISLQSENE